MTADEFERDYARRSQVTVDELRELGRVVRPCHCGSEDCDGWQSLSQENAAAYDAMRAVVDRVKLGDNHHTRQEPTPR
jgi:hypothetical protein